MLDQQKSVGDCTAQELVAALMLRAMRDAFNPEQVLQDLYANTHLWKSFWMGALLPLDERSLTSLLLLFLRDLQECWNADTLYVLAHDPACCQPLEAFGDRWNCDTVRVVTGELAQRLLGQYGDDRKFWVSSPVLLGRLFVIQSGLVHRNRV